MTTALIGGAALAISFDYFIERLKMTNWIWAHVKGREDIQFCWYSWLLLALWPTLFLLGIFLQHFLTAKGFTVHTCKYFFICWLLSLHCHIVSAVCDNFDSSTTLHRSLQKT